MKIYTIGFTKKTAEQFFETLSASGAKRLVDVRLNNVSQLAGFAKKQDLAYFLGKICGMHYVHLPVLAPAQDILDEYKKRKGDWQVYERGFLSLMRERRIEETISRDLLADSCLLCSEENPHHCHRRLVAEYLKEQWSDVEIRHLGCLREQSRSGSQDNDSYLDQITGNVATPRSLPDRGQKKDGSK